MLLLLVVLRLIPVMDSLMLLLVPTPTPLPMPMDVQLTLLLWFLNLLYLLLLLNLLMPFYVMEVRLILTSLQLVGQLLIMAMGYKLDIRQEPIHSTLLMIMGVLPLLIIR